MDMILLGELTADLISGYRMERASSLGLRTMYNSFLLRLRINALPKVATLPSTPIEIEDEALVIDEEPETLEETLVTKEDDGDELADDDFLLGPRWQIFEICVGKGSELQKGNPT